MGTTFISTTIAWVFFRSESFVSAINILTGMCGGNGIILPEYYQIKLAALASLVTLLGVNYGYVSYIMDPSDFLIIIVFYETFMIL